MPTTFAPGQRVLAEGKPATVLPGDHEFTLWCRELHEPPYGGAASLVCVELDRQDTHGKDWAPIPGVTRFSHHPHKFRMYPPSQIRPL